MGSLDPRGVRDLFDGSQLRLARELRGLTQVELGRLTGISGAAISQIEQGLVRPSVGTLEDIGRELRFPLQFFATDGSSGVATAFFRSLRTAPAKERRRARAFAAILRRFGAALGRYVDLPAVEVPKLSATPMDGPDQIEMLAQEVRRQWGLDAGPVADVAALMEGHGVLLARPLLATRQVDAFSVAFEDHPVVLLGADKGKRDRSRFDAAHELGHLVMHGPDYPQAEAERQAQQFAAALLMPQRDIRNELPARVDWNRLLALKGRWGTSIASLLYRARTLRVMKEPEYIRASKGLSARGWRVDEPGNLGPPEAPRLLSEAVRLAEEAGHTLLDIASEAGVPPEELSLILVAAQPRPRLSL